MVIFYLHLNVCTHTCVETGAGIDYLAAQSNDPNDTHDDNDNRTIVSAYGGLNI